MGILIQTTEHSSRVCNTINMAKAEQVLIFDPPDAIDFNARFEPSNELCLGELNLLSIHNPTDATVVYKVMTTAPTQFLVKPNIGRINAGETVRVELLLRPITDNFNLDRHKFMVQSIKLATQNNTDNPVNDLRSLFASAKYGEVMSTKLYCKSRG